MTSSGKSARHTVELWTLCVILVAFSAGASGADSNFLAAQSQAGATTAVVTYYRNVEYGFGVPMLKGVSARRDSPPNPNHGLVYELGPNRYVSVSGEFDAADYGSTRAQLDHWLQNENAHSSRRAKFILDGRPAEMAEFVDRQTVTQVIAYRRSDSGGILYDLVLVTSRDKTNEDQARFKSIVKRFKFYPLPK